MLKLSVFRSQLVWIGAIVVALAVATDIVAEERPQARQVPASPKGGRFPLPLDRIWPAAPGEADICLWKDDKFAAVSITIDDNCAPDHDWWVEQGERTGFRFTWFVITKGLDESKGGFGGTWGDFRKLKELGHDVQSHSVSHGSKDNERPDEELAAEYRDSQAAIEKHVGGLAVCLAYPWGKGKPALAGRYFVACRGVSGVPNIANRISYLQTGVGNLKPETVDLLLTGRHATVKWMNRPTFRRGWLCPIYHYVRNGRTPEEKDASQARVKAQIDHLYTKRDDIWVGLFRDVAFYGMERDTASLRVMEKSEKKIRFELTDSLDDGLFLFPLTVKVRLPNSWATVEASRENSSVATTLIRHGGAPFALVDVVPDRGEVSLVPGG